MRKAGAFGLILGMTVLPARGEPVDSSLREPCPVADSSPPVFRLTLNAGAYPLERTYPLADSFEVFRTGWEAHRASAELGRVWENLPPAADLEFRYAFSPGARIYLRMGLKRDISAWHDDPAGENWPLSDKEVDLNQPVAGYFHAENGWGAVTVGRFPVHWSPSEEYGLALSRSVPYHNGVMIAARMKRMRYLFLVSSLNPWLEGMPDSTDTLSTNYRVGSEEWQQRHYPGSLNDNAHLRVYDERIKTLITHRLEFPWDSGVFGITELSVVGGKTPDLRDLNPFGLWHNEFRDGFTSMAVSLDAKTRLPFGFSTFGELFLDDLRFGETESSSTPTILGWMLGLEHRWMCGFCLLSQSFHAIHTDDLMYRYLQPYNTLTSRFLLASNNQKDGANPFVDKYVVDYPLGYARGGGAMDWRYAARLTAGKTRATLHLDYLTFDGASLEIPFAALSDGSADKSPYQTEEWRVSLTGDRDLPWGLKVHAGAGWQWLLFPARNPRGPYSHGQCAFGLSWTFPR